MKTVAALSASVVICLVAVATLVAQGFDLRTGAWSITMTIDGAMPMDGLPPAARANLEAQLKEPQTFTSCVTPADLKDLSLGKPDERDDDECSVVSIKSTGKVADVTRKCAGDEPSTSTSHFEAPTPETLRGAVSRKSARGTMTVNLSGKWVAETCEE